MRSWVRAATRGRVDGQETARQMTLIESSLFRKIEARECLGQGWQGPKKYGRAPNISKIIDHTNNVR